MFFRTRTWPTPFPRFRLTKKEEIRGNVEKALPNASGRIPPSSPTNHGLVIVVHVDEWVSPRFDIEPVPQRASLSRSLSVGLRTHDHSSSNTAIERHCPSVRGSSSRNRSFDVDRTARPQDARRFPIQCRAVRRVACHLQKEDRIERSVWKRKPMKVGEAHPNPVGQIRLCNELPSHFAWTSETVTPSITTSGMALAIAGRTSHAAAGIKDSVAGRDTGQLCQIQSRCLRIDGCIRRPLDQSSLQSRTGRVDHHWRPAVIELANLALSRRHRDYAIETPTLSRAAVSPPASSTARLRRESEQDPVAARRSGLNPSRASSVVARIQQLEGEVRVFLSLEHLLSPG